MFNAILQSFVYTVGFSYDFTTTAKNVNNP